MLPRLVNIVTRHQVFLERLKSQTAVDFASVLPQLGDAIAEVMGRLESGTLLKLPRKQLEALLAELKAKQEELVAVANKKLVDGLKDLNKYETDFEKRSIEGLLGGAAKKIDLKTPDLTTAWKRSVEQPLSATGQLLEPFIEGWGENQVAGVDAAVRKAWAEGKTVSELMRDIRGTKALNYQDGLAAVSRRQAEAIARTSVQHVAQQARMATWEANADLVIGYTFIATLDGRTTSKCRSLDGMTFELGKGPVPPVHVNCRSTTIPKLPKEFDFLDEGATRSSKDGYVDAKQSYYDWLKGQPPEFQDEALGPARAKLFREGGLSSEKFAALNLGKNFEPLTLAQMQAKEPSLFAKTGVVVKNPIIGPDLSGEARRLDEIAKKHEEAARLARQAAEEAAAKARTEAAAAEAKRKAEEAAAIARARALEAQAKANEAKRVAEQAAKAAATTSGPGTKEHIEKQIAALKDLKKEYADKVPSGYHSTLYKGGYPGYNKYADELRQKAHDLLAVPASKRGTAPVFTFPNVKAKAGWRDAAAEAKAFVEKMVNKNRMADVRGVRSEDTRSFYDPNTKTLNMRDKAPAKIWVHEYMHAMEDTHRSVSSTGHLFQTKRRAGEPLQSLGFSDASEVYFKDKWIERGAASKYTGRVYPGVTGWKFTEVISTGAERLMLDPIGFAEQDPEYFSFMMKVLQSD